MNKKFREETVSEIRRKFWEDGATVMDLAKHYGVKHPHISHILSRKIWNQIDDGFPAYKEQLKQLPIPESIDLPEIYQETKICLISLLDCSYAKVSEIDYDYLIRVSRDWNITGNFPYVFDSKNYVIRMHDLVASRMNIFGEIIDHKDRDQRNNTRSNLRPATHSQSNFNRKYENNSTGYRGVTKNGKGFLARLWVKGQCYCMPTRETAEKAHEDYIEICKKFYGEFFDPDIHDQL